MLLRLLGKRIVMQYVHSMWLFSSADIKNFLKKAFIDTGIYMFLLLPTVFKKCEFSFLIGQKSYDFKIFRFLVIKIRCDLYVGCFRCLGVIVNQKRWFFFRLQSLELTGYLLLGDRARALGGRIIFKIIQRVWCNGQTGPNTGVREVSW